MRHPRETRLELVERIGEAYGLVLLLILVTFAVMMTLPPEGWGGRVAAVAVAGLTAVIGLTSSDVRAARVRLAVAVAVLAVVAALIAQAVSSERLVGLAFGADAILLAIAAAHHPAPGHPWRKRGRLSHDPGGDQRLYAARPPLRIPVRWRSPTRATQTFFTGVPDPRSSDYLFFSYTTLTTTGYGNLVPAGTVGQSFAVFEMLVGQFFLVTLVAGLVSLWRPGAAKAAVDADR